MNPNVLLLVLDSVRARNTSLHGYSRRTTPFLESYADGATVHTQARAPGVHSVASHASLWTGTEVDEHRMSRHEDELREGVTVWETLAKDGYATGLFTTNTVVAHASNLAAPFDTVVTDEFVDVGQKLFKNAHGPTDVANHEGVLGNLKRSVLNDQPVRSLLNAVHHLHLKSRDTTADWKSSADILEAFRGWRREQAGPWAACLNLMDAHYPYQPSDDLERPLDDRLVALQAEIGRAPVDQFVEGRPWWQLAALEHLYDGAIRRLDDLVACLVNQLERDGCHEETLVVVTSDHGEGFGEVSRLTRRTRMVGHSWGIHEVLTHVPLVVKYPGQTRAERVETPSTLSRFPAVVRESRRGGREEDTDPFVPDGPVVSSTDRLLKDDVPLFDRSDQPVDDYLGPWRAAYERVDGVTRKYARHGNQSIVLDVPDALSTCPVADVDGGERVDTVFEEFQPREIKRAGDRQLAKGVEDRLTKLGYIR